MDSRVEILKELCFLFLKLGTTSFGGPAAHIAMMEEEVVRKKKWLSHQQFLDLVSATHLIPGPNSTELAIHIGHLRSGWLGLIIAGISFIVPATLIVLACAWFYTRYGQIPQVASVFYTIKPVIIAIVLQALWSLGRSVIKTKIDAAVVFLVLLLAFSFNELTLLIGAGIFVASIKTYQNSSLNESGAWVLTLGTLGTSSATIPISTGGIFLTFLKIGSILYGSGYVLLAFLRANFVERLKWLTETQLLDAVAIGQITPGPVFTTATFIGYLLNGVSGAMAATAGIFLPAFIFVSISGLIVPYIRRCKIAGFFLDGLNLGSMGLMAFVSIQLGSSALSGLWTITIFLVALVLVVRYRMNSAMLILAAACLGLAKSIL
jgi:chromate transporter